MLRVELREHQRTRARRRRRRVFVALASATVCALVAGAALAIWGLPVVQNAMADVLHEDPPAAASQTLRVSSEIEHLPPESVISPVEPFEGFLTAAGPSIDVYDIDDPSSVTVVVNKQRPLDPIEWAPDDLVMPQGIRNLNSQPLRAEAAAALEEMHAAARAEGIRLNLTSAYRGYGMQRNVFTKRVAALGEEAAEKRSARPGYSEHQTGLAVDLDDGSGCELRACFGDTRAGLWLRENSHRFGYILRYDDGERAAVGYQYEPWHFRYVGLDVAKDMHENDIATLEAYFGLPDAPDY